MKRAQIFLQTPFVWRHYSLPIWAVLVSFVAVVGIILIVLVLVFLPTKQDSASGTLVTIYDEGAKKTILTEADTVAEALDEAAISVQSSDTVEPSMESQLIAENYSVNIYRARPVAVRDGENEKRIITAAQTGLTIAQAANIELSHEDEVDVEANLDVLGNDGSVMVATVRRAVPVKLFLYGQESSLKTQAKTVAEFISEKKLNVSDSDSVTPSRSAAITPNMEIRIWREGINTVAVEENIPFDTEQVYDYDQFMDYHKVRTPGRDGKKTITFEIEMHGGVEAARRQIQVVVTQEPVTQIEVVGVKSRGGTTSASENERITWFYLRNQGFSREQTAGIMGNLRQEHGFQTSGDGLAQWTGGRKANLMSMKDPYSIYTQLDFLMMELNGSYRSVKNNLLDATTIDQAVIIFQDKFERCGICMQQRRIQFAYEIFGRY